MTVYRRVKNTAFATLVIYIYVTSNTNNLVYINSPAIANSSSMQKLWHVLCSRLNIIYNNVIYELFITKNGKQVATHIHAIRVLAMARITSGSMRYPAYKCMPTITINIINSSMIQ